MAKFTSDKPVNHFDVHINQDEYETNDPAEVAALREHPEVREIHERSASIRVKVSTNDGHNR